MASAHARVVNIIQTTTGVKLNADEVAITNVVVNDNKAIQRNTKCAISATASGRLKGAGTFFYNRLDLSKVFYGQLPRVELPVGTRITTQELALLVAERFGIDLQAEDVEPSGSILLQQLPYDLELVAVPGSYCVTGSTPVRIVESGAAVDEAIGVRNFAGLNLPNGDLTKRQGMLYSWYWFAPLQMRTLLETAYHEQSGFVTAELVPYLTQLSGDNWVFDSEAAAPFNLAGAKVTYIGSLDDHPDYANSARSDTIAVVRLTELCGEVGGDLLITI